MVFGDLQLQRDKPNLIRLFVKQSSLGDDIQSAFFFLMEKVRGICIMSLWPPLSPLAIPELICIPHMLWSKAQRGDAGAGSREESLKIQKCHQPHGGDVNLGTLTGRQLNWLWWLLYHIKLHFAAQCHSTKKHNGLPRQETGQNQETPKPNYFILGTIRSVLELTKRKKT